MAPVRPRALATRLGSERGQTSAEYLGVVVFAVIVIGALLSLSPGIGEQIADKLREQVAAIASPGGEGSDPSEGMRAAPNLYAANTVALARRSLDAPDAVPAAPAPETASEEAESELLEKALDYGAETSGLKGARASVRALLEGALEEPLPIVGSGAAVDELSGAKDARAAVSALLAGDYRSALLSGLFAVPIGGKFLKGGKYARQALGWLARTGPGRALGRRLRGAWRRLADERGSVGLPVKRPRASNPKLRNALHHDYRGARNPNGSALDAARHTVRTGNLVRESTHLQKVVDMRNRYARILRRGGLDPADTRVTQRRYEAYRDFAHEHRLDEMLRARGLR